MLNLSPLFNTADTNQPGFVDNLELDSVERNSIWAAAGFKDTLLRWSMKQEIAYGNEKAIQPGIQS